MADVVRIEPMKPKEGNWKSYPAPHQEGTMYVSPLGIQVISSVHLIKGKPEYHISISDNGERIAASIVPHVLKQFGASDFEEDNHSPLRIIRSFWKKIESDTNVCDCKDQEPPVIDGDFVWREDKSGSK